MSSVPEKTSTTSIVEKRSFFLRTSSIQKIKCSATYPFRLAGTKFSKDAIKQLFETLIIKARVLSQKAFIDLLIATFKLIGVLISLWVGAPAKDACDNTKKTQSVLGFHERLLEKIHKLQKHKQRFDLKTKDLSSAAAASATGTGTGTPSNSKSLKVDEKNSSSFQDQDQIVKLRKITKNLNKSEALSFSSDAIDLKSSATSAYRSFTNDCNDNDNNADNNNPKKNYLLVLLVYSSAIFIYLQLLCLTIALNTTTHLPPGLLFLIFSLIFIGVIVFKMFLLEKPDKYEIKFKQNDKTASNSNLTKTTTTTTTTTTTSSTNNNNNDASRPTSRSRIRKIPMMIDLNSKTLSKIKIL